MPKLGPSSRTGFQPSHAFRFVISPKKRSLNQAVPVIRFGEGRERAVGRAVQYIAVVCDLKPVNLSIPFAYKVGAR